MRSGARAALARCAVGVTAAAAIVGAPTAGAVDERPGCRLVRDRRGDDAVQRRPAVVHLSDSLDIVSGDLATTPKVLIAVIRVAKLGLDDPASPAGQHYALEFTTGANRFRLAAKRTRTGDRFTGSVYGDFTGAAGTGTASMTSVGSVGGFFDDARSEVHIRVPIARLRPFAPFAEGDGLSRVRVDSYRHLGDADTGAGSWADEAVGGSARYEVGAPTCVPGS